MTKPHSHSPDIHGPRRDLAAFADGELDVEQNLAVLEHLAMHPEDTRRVMHQQQLRRAVATAMNTQTPTTPDDLRQRIESQLDPHTHTHTSPPHTHTTTHTHTTARHTTQQHRQNTATSTSNTASHRGVLAVIGRWAPTAVAALLFISTLTMIAFTQSNRISAWAGVGRGIYATEPGQLVSIKQIERFARRHVTCSRSITELHNIEQFPERLEAMPDKLSDYFHLSATPNLDLSALGYYFEKAGNCLIPGRDAVHMIYKAGPETGRSDSLSLWIKPYRGPDSADHDPDIPTIETNRVYRVTDADQAHPMFLWRSNDLIYYLVGDGSDQIEQAAQSLSYAGT